MSFVYVSSSPLSEVFFHSAICCSASILSSGFLVFISKTTIFVILPSPYLTIQFLPSVSTILFWFFSAKNMSSICCQKEQIPSVSTFYYPLTLSACIFLTKYQIVYQHSYFSLHIVNTVGSLQFIHTVALCIQRNTLDWDYLGWY